MRIYRLAPTLIAVLVFILIGNLLLGWILPGTPQPTPEDDMWLVYFAIMRCGSPPQQLGQQELGAILGALDSSAEKVGDRITVLSYSATATRFHLEATHLADDSTFRITDDGVD